MHSSEDSSPITVFVADDHPLMRKGLVLALAEEPSLQVIGEAADGATALHHIVDLKPAVAILDLDMPELDGFEITRRLAKLQLPTAVIILTLHSSVDLLFGALDLGVRGYILKSSAIADVVEGVHRVALGGSFLSEGMQMLLARRPQARSQGLDQLAALNPTEQRIVREIAAGFSSREIADALSLSSRTVENYRAKICAKLGLSGAHALTRFAISQRASFQTQKFHAE